MELISYALDFVSYLVQNLKERDMQKIKSIILFGSAARSEADKESDVDLFIDILGNDAEKGIKKISDEFYNSAKVKSYWSLLGIKNELNILVGDLEKWKLKDSMLGNAIVLYQKYSPALKEGKNKIILNWENIKPDSRRVMLNKKLFGYVHYGKRYLGLLEKFKGVKIGTNVIMVDAEHLNIFLKVFRYFKIGVKIRRVFEYG